LTGSASMPMNEKVFGLASMMRSADCEPRLYPLHGACERG
jgi:hypothetical protein